MGTERPGLVSAMSDTPVSRFTFPDGRVVEQRRSDMLGHHWPAPSVAVETSMAAADALDTPDGKKRRTTQRVQLLRLIAASETGKTDDELEVLTGLPGNTVCPRRGELHAAGYVDVSTMTRLTRRHRQARVWFATVRGRTFLDSIPHIP